MDRWPRTLASNRLRITITPTLKLLECLLNLSITKVAALMIERQ